MEDKKLVYQAPEVITYTAELLLEELGPAQTVGGTNGGTNGGGPQVN